MKPSQKKRKLPENPQYDDPQEAYASIRQGMESIIDIAKPLGIDVVYGMAMVDRMTDTLHVDINWSSKLSAGTIISHIQADFDASMSPMWVEEE